MIYLALELICPAQEAIVQSQAGRLLEPQEIDQAQSTHAKGEPLKERTAGIGVEVLKSKGESAVIQMSAEEVLRGEIYLAEIQESFPDLTNFL